MSDLDPPYDPKSFPPPWNYLVPLARKTLIWVVFFGALWLLRSFMPLVFLTFVFAYVSEHGVQGLAHRIESRKIRTAIVFVSIIGVLWLAGTFLAPELKSQAVRLQKDREKIILKFDESADQFKKRFELANAILGSEKLSKVLLRGLGLESLAPADGEKGAEGKSNGGETTEGKSKPDDETTGNDPQETSKGTGPSRRDEEQGAKTMPVPITVGDNAHVFQTVKSVLGILSDVAALGTAFLLSILFAFLIVRDLPRLAAGLESLKKTRLHFVYDEVRDTVVEFGKVLGRFLEAQLIIAIINTILTAIGMLLLGIEAVVFLSGVVFMFSFIPVAGVFISTVPICLVAIQQSGFGLAVGVVVMVTLVHMIEAYVLNPLIMGAHLRLNPVVVLAVLIIGHKLFGIWGLLLGVPTVTYVLTHAIHIVPRARAAADSDSDSDSTG